MFFRWVLMALFTFYITMAMFAFILLITIPFTFTGHSQKPRHYQSNKIEKGLIQKIKMYNHYSLFSFEVGTLS